MFKTRLLLAMACASISAAVFANERITVQAHVNGKPVVFAFDTGAMDVVLFPKAVERLGLKIAATPSSETAPRGEVSVSRTEPCELTLLHTTVQTSIAVVNVPSGLSWDIDGLLGWGPLQANIFRLDAANHQVTLVDKVSTEGTGWVEMPLETYKDTLFVKIPGSGNGRDSFIFVDTGQDKGVSLAPDAWAQWKSAHPKEPRTNDAYVTLGSGVLIREEAWAKTLAFGPLVLTDMPVTEANAVEVERAPKGYAATFGLAVLNSYDLIVDGLHGKAFWRRKPSRPAPYPHNRLGAVFVPRDLKGSDSDLVAHVVEGSPAWLAGIRNGDVLLKIDDLDVTPWRTDPSILPLSRFWTRPPGTRLRLIVQRTGHPIQATAVLKQILGPVAR